MNNTETTENISPNKDTGVSFLTNSTLLLGITKPLQILTKAVWSNSDNHNDPNTSENFKTQDNSFGSTSHRFQLQHSAILLVSQCKRTQGNLPMYNPLTINSNQIQNNQTVSNGPNRSNDQTSILKTVTTTVPTLSRPPLVPLNIADTHSLSSTDSIPFPTITKLHATANPSRTLYLPHTAHNTDRTATLLSSDIPGNPINPSHLFRRNYSVPFVAMKKSVKNFVGLDNQYTPEKNYIKLMHTWISQKKTVSQSSSC